MSGYNLAFFTFALQLSLAIASDASLAQEQPPAAVETAAVEEQDIAPTIWVPGTVISRQDSKVASEVSGVLMRVLEVGDEVAKGAVLAQVNDRQLQLQFSRDRADLARLQVRMTFAEKQLARTKSLSMSNSTAAFRMDELQMERDVIEQELALAKVKIAETQYLIERSKILAPFAGVVVERSHVAGEYIGVGEELLRIVNISNLEITAKAPVEVRPYIHKGQGVAVKADSRQLRSTIRSVIPIGDLVSRMLEVRINLSDEWVIGNAVSIALNKGPREKSLVVPRDALVLRNNQVYVYRVNDGTAEKINVKAGVGDEQNIAVSGNLNAGDHVVIRGAERLEDGRKIEIIAGIAKNHD